MATVKYTLEEFVYDMESLLKQQPDEAHSREAYQSVIFDKGTSYLESLINSPGSIPVEYRVPSGRGSRPNHGSYLLYRGAPRFQSANSQSDSGLLVTTVVWGPGDHAAPHDHHTWGMIGVVDNSLTETRFRRIDDASDPEYARLEEDRVGVFKPGEITLLVPDVDEIHQMDNHTDRPTVEIHVYGRELAGLNRCRFNLETGKISPFVTTKYDNE
jgi:predicted metal-dependent enzyme (double-stranded beta helix superfamily)